MLCMEEKQRSNHNTDSSVLHSLEQVKVAHVSDLVFKNVPTTAHHFYIVSDHFQVVSAREVVRAIVRAGNGYRRMNTSSREIKNRERELLVTYRASATAPSCSEEKGLGMLIRKVTKISSSHSTLLDGTPPEVNDPTPTRGKRRNVRTTPVTVESAAVEEVEEAEVEPHTKTHGAEEVRLM